VTCKDFGRNVVRSSDSRVCHQSSRSSPVVDLGAVAHGKVDLVDSYRVSVAAWLGRFALKKLLVIVVVVQLVETRRETEISQLDVATSVQENVIWLDVTVPSLAWPSRITLRVVRWGRTDG
jgi:hypothetical protein